MKIIPVDSDALRKDILSEIDNKLSDKELEELFKKCLLLANIRKDEKPIIEAYQPFGSTYFHIKRYGSENPYIGKSQSTKMHSPTWVVEGGEYYFVEQKVWDAMSREVMAVEPRVSHLVYEPTNDDFLQMRKDWRRQKLLEMDPPYGHNYHMMHFADMVRETDWIRSQVAELNDQYGVVLVPGLEPKDIAVYDYNATEVKVRVRFDETATPKTPRTIIRLDR